MAEMGMQLTIEGEGIDYAELNSVTEKASPATHGTEEVTVGGYVVERIAIIPRTPGRA